jgi:hypothetical protein
MDGHRAVQETWEECRQLAPVGGEDRAVPGGGAHRADCVGDPESGERIHGVGEQRDPSADRFELRRPLEHNWLVALSA